MPHLSRSERVGQSFLHDQRSDIRSPHNPRSIFALNLIRGIRVNPWLILLIFLPKLSPCTPCLRGRFAFAFSAVPICEDPRLMSPFLANRYTRLTRS